MKHNIYILLHAVFGHSAITPFLGGLHYVLQVFCVRQDKQNKKTGEGWTGGASDIVKAESSGEDPRATGGLVSNLPHHRVNKTKQRTII